MSGKKVSGLAIRSSKLYELYTNCMSINLGENV